MLVMLIMLIMLVMLVGVCYSFIITKKIYVDYSNVGVKLESK